VILIVYGFVLKVFMVDFSNIGWELLEEIIVAVATKALSAQLNMMLHQYLYHSKHMPKRLCGKKSWTKLLSYTHNLRGHDSINS